MPRISPPPSSRTAAPPTSRPPQPPPSARPPSAGAPKPGVNTLAMMKRDVVDVVAGRLNGLVASGGLQLPPNYSIENSLKSAWLILQATEDKNGRKALEVSTPDSVANALLDMAVQGLDPGKKQCYFIVYGSRLFCQRSYFGSMALVKRIFGPETEFFSEVVYEGDEFEYVIERGRRRVSLHKQKLANVNPKKIAAVYAIAALGDGREVCEIMTFDEVIAAWKQGQNFGKDNSPHAKFTAEMCRKTVLNRVSKKLINSSDDAHIIEAARRQEVSNTAVAVAALAAGAVEAAEELDFPPEEETGAGATLPLDFPPEEVPEEGAMREPGEDDEPEPAAEAEEIPADDPAGRRKPDW